MKNPIEKFQQCWQTALLNSPLNQKSAVCVSTIDSGGFPSGRFVDLKTVNELGFTFCTYLDSAKGKHLNQNPKTALTVWWDHVGYQVRVVGVAQSIEESDAVVFWKTRSRDAQLTTTAFEQSQPLATEEELTSRAEVVAKMHLDTDIPKPQNWGGYCVKPVSIEFLTFKESRLHLRELYEKNERGWIKCLLQP